MTLVLSIKTNEPKAELKLYVDGVEVDAKSWEAGRTLSNTLLSEIQNLLNNNQKTIEELDGLVLFKGPGSFTGLRIGATVANAIAFAQNIPIVATQGEDWQKIGLSRLEASENDKIALPDYGGEANITKPRK